MLSVSHRVPRGFYTFNMRRATTRRAHLLQDVSVARLPSSVCACGVRQSFHTSSRRPKVIASSNVEPAILQRRNITRQNIKRTEEAAEQWKGFAQEIKDGKRKAFLTHLEERGLVNQVVGSVSRERILCTFGRRYKAKK